MASAVVIEANAIVPIARGGGVTTIPYIGSWNSEDAMITTGITRFPPGAGIPLHTHNVDETVLIIEGQARVTVGEDEYHLVAGDATHVPTGMPHRFENRGGDQMAIYWTYSGRYVTRTICATGETFVHLSEQDRSVAHPG